MHKGRPAKIILANILVLFGLLVVLEGFSSYALVGYRLLTNKPTPERPHTAFDAELGWINLPDLHVKDRFGPGRSLTTNSQRFRNRVTITPAVPPNKIRLICSGDSFTLGYGVDDAHAWCHLLTKIDARLQTVNLGHGGYGVDQAYLWYERNKNDLEHDVHLFAFIADDFRRMTSGTDTYTGYARPYLSIENQEISQTNYPLSKRSVHVRRIANEARELTQLASVDLLSKIYRRILSAETSSPAGTLRRTEAVVAKIFSELQQSNSNKSSVFVLVFLPTREDYMGRNAATEHWRQFTKSESEKNGFYFVDLIEDFRTVHPTGVDALFRDHYSEQGNKLFADLLYRKLGEIPEIRRRLDRIDQAR